MRKAQTPLQAGSSCTRERIVQAAIRLYREIGYRKTRLPTSLATPQCRPQISIGSIPPAARSKRPS
jgi:hypothetical protein